MLLEMRGIDFSYPGADSPVLQNFDLAVEKGEIVAIVGASGCGKSTVLRLIAGLEEPSRGAIRIHGREVVGEAVFVPPEKRKVGMVFQDYALFPHLTVTENIAFGLGKMPKQEQQERVKRLLCLAGLEEHERRYPHQLSGGQQQRVAVVRALAPNPELLLMDEPFSNIDQELKCRMRQEIQSLLKQEKATCIFVTHDQTDVVGLSDRVVSISVKCQTRGNVL